MSIVYRPRDTTPGEDARALGVAVGAAFAVGALTLWLMRLLLGRDAISLEPGDDGSARALPPGDLQP